ILAEINRRMLTHLQTFVLKDFVPEIVTCHNQNDANLIGAAANFQAKTNWEL
ncbi:ROK family protein, partial [Enterococcus faecalis]